MTASALDLAQASLPPAGWFDNLHMLCVYMVGASDKRKEPQAKSKAEAVVSEKGRSRF